MKRLHSAGDGHVATVLEEALWTLDGLVMSLSWGGMVQYVISGVFCSDSSELSLRDRQEADVA